MYKIEDVVQYFKRNDGYKRLFNKMRIKIKSFERENPGTILIENPTKEEKETLSGFMKKDYSKNKSISINLKVFQEILNNTKFRGFTLKEVLEEYFKERIISNKEENRIYEQEINDFFIRVLQEQKNTYIYNYMKKIIEEKNNIYKMLRLEYSNNKDKLQEALSNVCKVVNNLPKKMKRLPILSAEITKNPHLLDKGNLTGNLFITFLAYVNNIEKPNNSAELAELYYKNNILIDDLSNMVLCKSILGYKNGKVHRAWLGFEENNEPFQATLYNLSKIESLKVKNKNCLVVENPAVFTVLSELENLKNVPIICTYGQVKLAGIVLLDLLVKQNVNIYYSGDIDPEGMQIADKLKMRYKNNLKLIGFNKEVYYKNMSDVTLNNIRIKKLDNLKDKELIDLATELRINKKVAYEEVNIEYIQKIL